MNHRAENLAEYLRQMADMRHGEPGWIDLSHEVARYALALPTGVAANGLVITVDKSGHGVFDFSVQLGPANAARLIDFLKALGPEPKVDFGDIGFDESEDL